MLPSTSSSAKYNPLPFDCCAFTLQPFENPVCTNEGVIFDLENILQTIENEFDRQQLKNN